MNKRNYYSECPICGACLDPGEHCDCQTNSPVDSESHNVDSNNNTATLSSNK